MSALSANILVYSRVAHDDAERVLTAGFKDVDTMPIGGREHHGVLVGDTPPPGDGVLLSMHLPHGLFLAHELAPDVGPDVPRHAFVPAAVLNQFGPPRVHREAGTVEPDVELVRDPMQRRVVGSALLLDGTLVHVALDDATWRAAGFEGRVDPHDPLVHRAAWRAAHDRGSMTDDDRPTLAVTVAHLRAAKESAAPAEIPTT